MEIVVHPNPRQPLEASLQAETGFCATIGFFDGVHLGHRFLLRQLQQTAIERGMRSMVITFDTHPRCALQTDYRPLLLTTTEQKLRLLAESQPDVCAVLTFDESLARLSAHEFMQRYLRETLGVRCLLIGHDHRFGSGRSDGFEEYRNHGSTMGIEVVQSHAFTEAGLTYSSSSVRRALEAGKVSEAALMLARPYALCGTVVEGRRVGRNLGFPTANLRIDDPNLLIPATGVYAVRAEVEGKTYGAMLNIGQRPTLNNGNDRTIEAHLFDFSGDLYGKPLCLHFIERLRDEQRFSSLDELRLQLCKDAEKAKEVIMRDTDIALL